MRVSFIPRAEAKGRQRVVVCAARAAHPLRAQPGQLSAHG